MQAFIQAPLTRLNRNRYQQRTSPSASPRANLSEEPTLDWRAFRARLVQSESSVRKSTKPDEWAHEVPFVEAGSLLIASPEHFVGEHACSFFASTVVLILSHTKRDGTVGVIVNRPIAASVSELKLRDSQPAPLYLGGPVGLDGLLVVHDDNSVPGAVSVCNGVVTSGVREVLRRIEKGDMRSDVCRFLCGYSGWSAGQLQEEIDNGVWYTCACCPELVMRHCVNPSESLVRKLLRLMGGKYTEIGNRLDEKGTERNFDI